LGIDYDEQIAQMRSSMASRQTSMSGWTARPEAFLIASLLRRL